MGTYTHSEPNKQFYKNRKSSKMSSTMDKTKAKAKEVAIEDFNKAKALAQSAAKSGAYLYPSRRPNILLRLRRPLLHPILSLPPTLVPILLQDNASPRPQRSQRASSIALPRRYEDRQSGSVTE